MQRALHSLQPLLLQHPAQSPVAVLPALARISRFYADGFSPTDPSSSTSKPLESKAADLEQRSGLGAGTSTPELSEADAYLAQRRKGKRPTRLEKGRWRGNREFNQEIIDTAPIWPENVPAYDLQNQLPFFFETSSPLLEMYNTMRESSPEAFQALLDHEEPEEQPPWEGANKILEWEIMVVFETGPIDGEQHPLNKKVKCRVYLRDLQKEFGLTDEAIRHIALICGPRYNPNTGQLTLTSEKTRYREENRMHISDILNSLVAEGMRAYPQPQIEMKDEAVAA